MSKKKNSQEQENEELILGPNHTPRLQEDEEVERAKEFWDKNKSGIIGGVVLGLGFVFGYNYWQSYKLEQGKEASNTYANLTEALSNEQDAQKREELVTQMLSQYDSSVYAPLAAMQMAKQSVDNNDFEQAEQYLSQAVEVADDTTLKNIARVRLARVKLQLEKYDEVIEIAQAQGSSSFSATYQELLGDAYVAKGDNEQAKAAYQRGVELINEKGLQPGILEFKLNSLN